MGDSLAVNRRSFVRGALTAGGLAAIGSFAPSLRAASSARTVRLRWPWPVHLPDPHAAGDLVAALLGATIFPPLYVRAIDGLLEPRLAIGAPHETRRGLRVDLPYWIRQSDVVASISAAKSGGARLALKDVPVPRLDGYHGVLFPGLGDIDGLVRRLATPLAGIARIERRRLASTGAFDVSLQERESTRALILVRRPLAAMPGIPTTLGGAAGRGVQRFELEGAIELGATLRAFERLCRHLRQGAAVLHRV